MNPFPPSFRRRLALASAAALFLALAGWLGPRSPGSVRAQSSYVDGALHCHAYGFAMLNWNGQPAGSWGSAYGSLWYRRDGQWRLDGRTTHHQQSGSNGSAVAYNYPTRSMAGLTWRETGDFNASFFPGWRSWASGAKRC